MQQLLVVMLRKGTKVLSRLDMDLEAIITIMYLISCLAPWIVDDKNRTITCC